MSIIRRSALREMTGCWTGSGSKLKAFKAGANILGDDDDDDDGIKDAKTIA